MGARAKMKERIGDYLSRRGIVSLVRVEEADTPAEGMERLVSTYGFGPLVPNTILLGTTTREAKLEDYCDTLRTIHDLRRNVVVLRHNEERGFGRRRRIDVWWGGLQRNGGLMMILGYLLRTSIAWRQATLRIKLIVDDERAAESARASLGQMVSSLRIGAQTEIIVQENPDFPKVLRESSSDADLILLGMAMPGQVPDYPAYYRRLQEMTDGMPTTAFVLASENMDFAEVLL